MATEGKKLIQRTVRAYHLSPGWVSAFGIRRKKTKKKNGKHTTASPCMEKTAAVCVRTCCGENLDEASVSAQLFELKQQVDS